jgi:hypothetical protein
MGAMPNILRSAGRKEEGEGKGQKKRDPPLRHRCCVVKQQNPPQKKNEKKKKKYARNLFSTQLRL